jgi:hypothetical protein
VRLRKTIKEDEGRWALAFGVGDGGYIFVLDKYCGLADDGGGYIFVLHCGCWWGYRFVPHKEHM